MSTDHRRFDLIAAVVLMVFVLSCGDSPSDPPDPHPTPSLLTAVYTGEWFPPDTSKGTRNLVELSWTPCEDDDFERYTIYRSLYPDIESLPDSAEILHITFDPLELSYLDYNLDWDDIYYYVIRTTDTDTLHAWSNEEGVVVLPQTHYGGPDSISQTISVGDAPAGITSLPSSEYVYVVCYYQNTIDVINTSTYSVTSVPVGNGPMDVCSTDDHVYVSCSSSGEVQSIRTSDNTVDGTVDVGAAPAGICITPDGERIYVCCYGSDEVWCLDAPTLSVIDVIPVGDGPWDICSLPDGERVYCTNRIEGCLYLIWTSDNHATSTLNINTQLTGITASSAGDRLYVCDFSDSELIIFNPYTGGLESSVPVGMGPMGVLSIPNGSLAYVTCYQDHRIDFVELSSSSVVYSLPCGISPNGICSDPSGQQVYCACSSSSTVDVLVYTGPGWPWW